MTRLTDDESVVIVVGAEKADTEKTTEFPFSVSIFTRDGVKRRTWLSDTEWIDE